MKCREESQLCKLSKLCFHFLSSFENEYIFFISLAIPRPLPTRIHRPIKFTKKITFLYIFKNERKQVTSLNIHPGDSWPYRQLIKLQKSFIDYVKCKEKRKKNHPFGVRTKIKKKIYLYFRHNFKLKFYFVVIIY